MTTLNLSGYQGQQKIFLGPFDLYLCDPTWQLDTLKTATTTQSGRLVINSAPDGAEWRGGLVHGLMNAETEYSMYSTTGNGGAPFEVNNCNGLTVRKLKIDGHCWDPTRVASGMRDPLYLECWFQDARDDCIEADGGDWGTVYVRRSFMDNVHTYISTTPGSSLSPPPYRWVFDSCLLSLANNHRDSREIRKYAWNPTDYGSGGPWKGNGSGTDQTLRINNCTLMWRRLPKSSTAGHRLIQTNAVLEAGSGGNVFVWLGPQTSVGNGGVPVVSVSRIGGGTMFVPESVLGTGTERTRILNTYTFTDSETYWNNAVTAWQTNVWGAAPVASPPTAVNDTNQNVEVGGNIITVQVLSNDTNVDPSFNPVVTKQGVTSGPVTTAVANNTLRVTSSTSTTGAWSQPYRVTTTQGNSDAIASGTVTATPAPTTGIQILPHQSAWSLSSGGIVVSLIMPETFGVRQGIFSKDYGGIGASHVLLVLTIGGTFSLRMQDTPAVEMFLETAAPLVPGKEVELLFTFGPSGTSLYMDRVLKDTGTVAWDLVGNTEPLIIGADSSFGVSGGTLTKDPFLGSVEGLQILTATEVTALLAAATGASGQSTVDADVPPPLGLVSKSAIRANLAIARRELLNLGYAAASQIDATKPQDGVTAVQAELRANFARIRSAIISLGGTSTIDATIPADGVAPSRSAIRANFAAARTAINARIVALNVPTTGPAFQQAAAVNASTTPATPLTPAYPLTTFQANDIFLTHIVIHADADASCTPPAGWLLVGSSQLDDLTCFVFAKTATGTESGTASFAWTGNNLTGVRVATSWMVRYRVGGSPNPAAVIESGRVEQGSGLTGSFPSILANGTGRRAIAFFGINGLSTNETNPTGETGGDWLWRAKISTSSGDDAASFLYDADMPSGGVMSGGTVAQNVGDRWSIIAFAIR